MNFVVIVFLACAVGQPDHCEDKHLQFAWQGSLRQCVMAAQPYIAQWIGDHPQWMVRNTTANTPTPKTRPMRADPRAAVACPVAIG
jgi:hypothetical protein